MAVRFRCRVVHSMNPLLGDSGNSLVQAMHLLGNDRGPLWGLRYVAKDNIDIADVPTNNGNPLFNAWRGTPAVSASVVRSLQEAGATLVGKSILHELAYGLTGINR